MQTTIRNWSIVSVVAAMLFGAMLLVPMSTHADTSISIVNGSYSPSDVTVSPGTTVTWKNNGTVAHTVTADDGSFGSPLLNPGDTYSHTFSTAGTFRYYCIPHGGPSGVGMSAILYVSSSSTTSTSTSATSTPSGGTGTGGTGTTTSSMSTSSMGTSTIPGGNSQEQINYLLRVIAYLRAQIQNLLNNGYGGGDNPGFPGGPPPQGGGGYGGDNGGSMSSNEGVAVYADRYTVQPGDTVTFSGEGFGSNENVRVDAHGMTVATVHTNSDGSFTMSHQAPDQEMTAVMVTFTGVSSGRSDSVEIDIQNEE